MPCYHPLTIYRSKQRLPTGGRWTFDRRRGYHDLTLPINCGQCIGCRLEKSRQWAVRAMHEVAMHTENCFITLTYNDDTLPPGATLVKRDWQLFMKRLRKEIAPQQIRFLMSGEYGDVGQRPHYHACIFGMDFSDKSYWTTRRNNPVWRSETLEKLWTAGNSEIGTVTYQSAQYVAGYVVKKLTGPMGKEEYKDREPPFALMSRNPGLGRPWYNTFNSEMHRSDSVILNQREQKPPRYYDNILAETDPTRAEAICSARRRLVKRSDTTPRRLAEREEVTNARLQLKKGSL